MVGTVPLNPVRGPVVLLSSFSLIPIHLISSRKIVSQELLVDQDPHFEIANVSNNDDDIVVWHFDSSRSLDEAILLSYETLRAMIGGIDRQAYFFLTEQELPPIANPKSSELDFWSCHQEGCSHYFCWSGLGSVVLYKSFEMASLEEALNISFIWMHSLIE